MLAPSAFLASAAFTLPLQNVILPPSLANVDDLDKASALSSWKFLSHAEEPIKLTRGIQNAWDGPVASAAQSDLLSRAKSSIDQARLLSACAEYSGDWLRLNDEMVRISIATRLGARVCEPHTCSCGKEVDARGLHGLSCRKSAARHIRHAHLMTSYGGPLREHKFLPLRSQSASPELVARDLMKLHSFHGQEERRLRGMLPWPILSPFLTLVTRQY